MGESPPPDRKEFVARVGTFFVLVGIGLMVFFILSESAKVPTLSYFCWGTILLTFGFIFHGQFKRPPGPPHGRFSIFGKIKNALKRKPKEEKKKEEKKK
jgi:predicted membrane channel-forming protein YqfA (hemolysin III family)